MTDSNKFASLARIYNLKLDEIFKLRGIDGKLVDRSFFFSDRGLLAVNGGDTHNSIFLYDLLVGNYTVVKASFRPKYNEYYYCWRVLDGKLINVQNSVWTGNLSDLGCLTLKKLLL